MTEESDFQKYRPKLTEVTVVQTAEAWGQGDEILSLNGKRTGLSHFILLLATDVETHGPFLINGVCARELCALLLEICNTTCPMGSVLRSNGPKLAESVLMDCRQFLGKSILPGPWSISTISE